MFNDISYGSFYLKESLVHKLNPVFKIISVMIMIIAMFFINSYNDIIMLLSYLLLSIVYSNISIKLYLKNIYSIRIFLIFIIIIDLLFTPSVSRVVIDIFKLVFIIMYSSILTYTTATTEMTYGIERILRPFNRIIPVNDISMIITLTIRYIPTLSSEYSRIVKAQTLRGVNFKEGNTKSRIKKIVSVLTPMFILSLSKAEKCANVMDIRLYNYGKSRTNYRYNKWCLRDTLLLILNILILIIVIYY